MDTEKLDQANAIQQKIKRANLLLNNLNRKTPDNCKNSEFIEFNFGNGSSNLTVSEGTEDYELIRTVLVSKQENRIKQLEAEFANL